jgi:hypothetical protein
MFQLRKFLGFLSGAVEVSVLVVYVTPRQWMVSARRFDTVWPSVSDVTSHQNNGNLRRFCCYVNVVIYLDSVSSWD